MTSERDLDDISYLSTGVVARALGLDQAAVRAMIALGTLPQPQWMTLGSRVERVYSLEWLVLAREQLNLLVLPGLEFEIAPENSIQFALRFDQTNWTLAEVAHKLAAIETLWNLCTLTVGLEDGVPVPPLRIRRLSAGSPLDVLAWVIAPGLPIGGAAALLLFIIKNPEKLASAIPRIIAAWRDGWAGVDESKLHQLEARAALLAFEDKAAKALGELNAIPSGTALSGPGTYKLEITGPSNDLDSDDSDPSDPSGADDN